MFSIDQIHFCSLKKNNILRLENNTDWLYLFSSFFSDVNLNCISEQSIQITMQIVQILEDMGTQYDLGNNSGVQFFPFKNSNILADS